MSGRSYTALYSVPAGLARTPERIDSRSPSPPARTMAVVRFTSRMLPHRNQGPEGLGARHHPGWGRRGGAPASDQAARVDRGVAPVDLPVEVGTGSSVPHGITSSRNYGVRTFALYDGKLVLGCAGMLKGLDMFLAE